MKKLTKKQEQMLENYESMLGRYGLRELNDVYDSYSIYKAQAQAHIKNEMQDINKITHLFASDYTITGYNCMMFSCAYTVYDWKVAYKDRLTKRAIVYHTAYNRYIIPLDNTIEEELEEVFNK